MNLLNQKQDPDISHYMDLLGSNLILPQILLPTRITEHSKTLIDNIFTTISGRKGFSGNLIYTISDHLPQFCIMFDNSEVNYQNQGKYSYKNWSKFDQDSFILDFLEIEWKTVMYDQPGLDINQCYEIFDSAIQKLVNKHVPTVKMTKK